jgi:hypothetical protein
LGTSVALDSIPAVPWWNNTPAHYRDEVLAFAETCGPLCPDLNSVNLVVKDDLLSPDLIEQDAIAMCRMYIENLRLVREIVMDLRYKGSPLQQRATLWHELIHCVLHEDHVQRWEFDLMDPNDRSHNFYLENWDDLVTATFCRIARSRRIEREGCSP